jgi:hypothetical protein
MDGNIEIIVLIFDHFNNFICIFIKLSFVKRSLVNFVYLLKIIKEKN